MIPAAHLPYDPLRDAHITYGEPGSKTRIEAYRQSVNMVRADICMRPDYSPSMEEEVYIPLLQLPGCEPGMLEPNDE